MPFQGYPDVARHLSRRPATDIVNPLIRTDAFIVVAAHWHRRESTRHFRYYHRSSSFIATGLEPKRIYNYIGTGVHGLRSAGLGGSEDRGGIAECRAAGDRRVPLLRGPDMAVLHQEVRYK